MGTLPLDATIVILGAGRLGLHLTAQLRFAGASSLTLWNRSPLDFARQSLLETPTQAPPACFVQGALPCAALAGADCVLLCTADDALGLLASRLERETSLPTACPVAHCSGALSGDVLEALKDVGQPVGSFHPLQSFSGDPSPGDLTGTFFALEGDSEVIEAGQQLVAYLKGRAIHVRTDGKVLYHAAAVVASNLLVALVDTAVDVMGHATGDLSRERRLELLLPLIEGTVRNLGTTGLPGALTGPISRGDTGVIERHLEALSAGDLLETSPSHDLYRLLSQRALMLAEDQGLPTEVSERLKRLLIHR